MKLNEFILDLAGHPRGILAPIYWFVFNRGNRILLEASIDAMQLKPDGHALDIGFGGGYSLPLLLQKVPSGTVTATDISEEMLAAARKRYRTAIASEKPIVRDDSVDAMADDDGTYDAAMSANTFYFWPDVNAGLREVLRVLKPGGRFVLANRTRETLLGFGFDPDKHNLFTEEEITERMRSCGFASVEVLDPGDRVESRLFVGVKG